MKEIFVLSVDDDPNMQRLIQFYLAPDIFKVTSVSSARLALHHLGLKEFDLMISDLQMPQMDGIELVRAVRMQKPHLPVIIISAYGKSSKEEEVMKAGANYILEKPFEQKKLITTISHLLNKSHS